MRSLVVVFGDQLDSHSAAFDGFDLERDAVHMAEVHQEASYIRQHKLRLALFFSAMRHFRDACVQAGRKIHYTAIGDHSNTGSLAGEIKRRVKSHLPEKLIALEPGDYRVRVDLERTARELGISLEIRPDRHFYCSVDQFREYAEPGRKLVMENFYRRMRQQHGVLMRRGKPAGGQWNFDKDNRKPLNAAARRAIRPPVSFSPDDTTRAVIADVAKKYADSPGRLDHFDYPVTRRQAITALGDFIEYRLPNFGAYQDAMVEGEDNLFHSRLSCALNLHLLNPAEVIEAAVKSYESGQAPINSVEGFVRQVLGWREFVRGIYWTHMPGYEDRNALDATHPVPLFLWNAETEMNCARHAVQSLIDHAWTHHIHRLMVLGLYCLLLGVDPKKFHDWHMSMFIDAIDWVSLPNALGMSQYGDGGIMGTKPYCASGRYIKRMSDYCRNCRYNPEKATGADACPITTLYWDFLARNREQLTGNPRMLFQLKNLDAHSTSDLIQIRKHADRLRA